MLQVVRVYYINRPIISPLKWILISFDFTDLIDAKISNMYDRFLTSIDKLDGDEEATYVFLLTLLKYLRFHLHLDRSLKTLMNDGGILSLYLNNITIELEERRRKIANTIMC